MSDEVATLEVFLCYRRKDGQEYAQSIYDLLNAQPIPPNRLLKVYYDKHAPAVGNWMEYHQPSLESAYAMIVIITPGLCAKHSGDDWVHREIDWWVKNRETAPIIVETTGEGSRWLPDSLKPMCETSQRVELEGTSFGHAEAIREQIIEGIRLSFEHTIFADLEQQKRVHRRLSVATWVSTLAASGAAMALIFALISAGILSAQLSQVQADAEAAVDEARSNIQAAVANLEDDLEEAAPVVIKADVPDVVVTTRSSVELTRLPIPASKYRRLAIAVLEADVRHKEQGATGSAHFLLEPRRRVYAETFVDVKKGMFPLNVNHTFVIGKDSHVLVARLLMPGAKTDFPRLNVYLWPLVNEAE